MSAPLDGVIVVALEQAIAAPLATRHLADLGATIIKIERPDGGDFARHYDTNFAGNSTFFVWGNRGKESIILDLKDPLDRETFDDLVAGADVFIQNLSPRAAEAVGVQAHELHERYPSLIACDISGYGLGGPRTDDKAYDLAIQAEAGAIALTGSADDVSKVGFSVADISAGMYALSSILAALVRRASTGEGAAIELSMLECLSEWTAVQSYAAAQTKQNPGRSGHRHAFIAPYGIFSLRDGGSVLLVVQNQTEWESLATNVLERPDLITDERFATNEGRIANVEELEVIITACLATMSDTDARRRLSDARIANAQVRSSLEVWGHEQLRARDRFMDVRLPNGAEVQMFRPPFNISDTPDPTPKVPALGGHDEGVIAYCIDRGARRTPAWD